MASHDTDDLRDRVAAHFRAVHRDVFMGDPAANSKLKVDVVVTGEAGGSPYAVIITPWMLNGLAFTPEGTLPDRLTVGAKEEQVFFADIQGLGPCHMVPLADVANLPDHSSARTVAEALSGPFADALERAGEQREVGDPDRRRLFRGDFGSG